MPSGQKQNKTRSQARVNQSKSTDIGGATSSKVRGPPLMINSCRPFSRVGKCRNNELVTCEQSTNLQEDRNISALQNPVHEQETYELLAAVTWVTELQ